MQENNNQKYVIVATLAFIIGFGLAWLIMANKNVSPSNSDTASSTETMTDTDTSMTDETSSGTDTTAMTPSVKNDTVVVEDQAAGTSVTVSKVSFREAGWVVIYEDNSGAPGRILGAQLFDAGTWPGTVELLRGTVAGQTYYAVLSSDNGDRAFDPKKDEPLKGENGAMVVTTFKAQ